MNAPAFDFVDDGDGEVVVASSDVVSDDGKELVVGDDGKALVVGDDGKALDAVFVAAVEGA